MHSLTPPVNHGRLTFRARLFFTIQPVSSALIVGMLVRRVKRVVDRFALLRWDVTGALLRCDVAWRYYVGSLLVSLKYVYFVMCEGSFL